MDFDFSFHYQDKIPREEPAYWFIFRQEKILAATEGNNTKPLLMQGGDLPALDTDRALHIGRLDGVDCYALADDTPEGLVLPHTEWVGLRRSAGRFDEQMFHIYGRARQLLLWAENNRYCGRCGNRTALKTDERCFLCPSCGLAAYPRLSPAVIVSIVRDGKLLLATSARFQVRMFSVLAGFVEPGECLEECVRREIREETGIEVKNIRYFKSQPWPFPDSLMVGFTSEYAGGELKIDGREIVEAGWYGPDELPAIPGKISIARALIDRFIEQYAGTA